MALSLVLLATPPRHQTNANDDHHPPPHHHHPHHRFTPLNPLPHALPQMLLLLVLLPESPVLVLSIWLM
jgi:hypothetical protein